MFDRATITLGIDPHSSSTHIYDFRAVVGRLSSVGQLEADAESFVDI